jgi:hypothetical protein
MIVCITLCVTITLGLRILKYKINKLFLENLNFVTYY